LIYTPSGKWASPRFLEDGRFVSTAEDRLTPGQFSASDIIDDREEIRIEVLRQRFTDNQNLPRQPRFYFWTTPLEAGMRTQTEGRQVGDALVGLPIVFETPPAESQVFCPDYFISYRSILAPGRGSSMAYSNHSRQWSDLLLRKNATTLQFQLPPALGKFQLQRLKLLIDINAPDRSFHLLALDQRNPEWKGDIAERNSPVGQFEFEVSGESLPPLNEDLTFVMGLDVGPRSDDPLEKQEPDPSQHAWQIRNVWVEAWGTVLE
jgi:hypothetical protein